MQQQCQHLAFALWAFVHFMIFVLTCHKLAIWMISMTLYNILMSPWSYVSSTRFSCYYQNGVINLFLMGQHLFQLTTPSLKKNGLLWIFTWLSWRSICNVGIPHQLNVCIGFFHTMINHKQMIEINNPKMINFKILTNMNHTPFFPFFLESKPLLICPSQYPLNVSKKFQKKSSFFVTQTWVLSNAFTFATW